MRINSNVALSLSASLFSIWVDYAEMGILYLTNVSKAHYLVAPQSVVQRTIMHNFRL